MVLPKNFLSFLSDGFGDFAGLALVSVLDATPHFLEKTIFLKKFLGGAGVCEAGRSRFVCAKFRVGAGSVFLRSKTRAADWSIDFQKNHANQAPALIG